MTIPASKINAPVQTVELQSFVGERNKDGTWELTPHTFLKVTDSDGNTSYVGFAPQVTGLAGNGQIQNDALHPVTNSSGPISLTPEQGARLQEYINNSIDNPPYYNLPGGEQCAVWAANSILEGITGHGLDINAMPGSTQTNPLGPYGTLICELINPYTLALFNDVFQVGSFLKTLLSSVGEGIADWWKQFPGYETLFTSAQNYVYRRDPLVLDLDGDGIETTAVTTTTPTMFDYNGDGTKTATGWIKSDDGFLVMDRNGNGTIDNASELFSDYTTLNAGGNAADGYAALAQEDTNNDGIINNLDANWSDLRVWQDANSDGISQINELHTLDELGISGINVAKTNTSLTLADGNNIKGTGTYTKTDGTTGQTGDVNLKVDTSNQQFADTIPVIPEAAALPDMTGSGPVRTLHEAASMSPALQTILTQYSQATTRNEQLAIIDRLLYAWADTSGMAATMDERDPEHYRIQYYAFGNENRSDNYIHTGNTGSTTGGTSGVSVGPYIPDVENTMLTKEYRDLITQWNHKLHILEAFNGRYFFAFPEQKSAEGETAKMGIGVYTNTTAGIGSTIKQ